MDMEDDEDDDDLLEEMASHIPPNKISFSSPPSLGFVIVAFGNAIRRSNG